LHPVDPLRLGIPHHEPDWDTRALLEQSLGRSRLAELMSAAEALYEDEAIRLVIEASPGVSDARPGGAPR
jgi:hypothetical protein